MKNEKQVILFPIASHFLFHFYEIAFPALAIPLTLSLGMSLKDVLALGFPMYVAFGIFALPWGLFADHYNNRLALIIGFFGCAAGSFLTALISFLIMATVIYFGVVMPYNKAKEFFDRKKQPAYAGPTTESLLAEIRDLLKEEQPR